MISSLWPSQKTSVSINQAAGRRHMEHSVTLMVLAQNKRGAIARNPSSFGYSVSCLRGGPFRLSLIHSLDELCQEPKSSGSRPSRNAEIIENSVELGLRNLRSHTADLRHATHAALDPFQDFLLDALVWDVPSGFNLGYRAQNVAVELLPKSRDIPRSCW